MLASTRQLASYTAALYCQPVWASIDSRALTYDDGPSITRAFLSGWLLTKANWGIYDASFSSRRYYAAGNRPNRIQNPARNEGNFSIGLV